MKKTIRTILYAAAFAVLAVSCQKEIEGVEPETNTKATIEISINGLMGEYTPVDATKASLVNNIRVSWEGGETVFVYDGTQCLGKLIASLDANGDDRYALLSTDAEHTVSKPVDGTKYLTLVYSPLLSAAPDVKEGAISISLAEQNSTKAPFVAYATLDYTGTTIIDALVPFRFATSVIKVNCCGLKANTAIDNATLSNVNTACKLTLSGTATPSVAGDVNGNIIRTEDTYFSASKVNADGEAVFQIAVPVLSAGTRSLTILQGTSIFEDNNFSQSALSTATSVNTVCQLAERPVAPEGGLTGKFTVNATGRQVYFSRGNLQATSQGDGSYSWDFADHQYDVVGGTDYSGAGSATGNNTIGSQAKGARVDLFGWSTATTYYGISTSKNNDDYSGDFEDWGTTIDTDDTWRTLSRNEWSYLLGDNPIRKGKSKIAVQVCGIKGLVLAPDNYTGTIQDSYDEDGWLAAEEAGMVFLPAAGIRYTTDAGASVVGNLLEYGYYWSSTVSDLGSPFMLLFSNSSYGGGAGYIEPNNSDNCSSGRSVRLVKDKR